MSRLKSVRGAKASAKKGSSSSRSAVAARTPGGRQVMVASARSDIYVALLGVALGAIVLGCLLLALVMNKYGFSTKAAANQGKPAALVAQWVESAPFSNLA